MTSSSDAMSQAAAAAAAIPARRVRPFFWSVRRELWENRSLYLAPAIAAAVVLAGIALAALRVTHFQFHGAGDVPPKGLIVIPFAIAAGAITVTGVLAGVFYCLGALNGERRDRSILFWKSLPVSNLTAVTAKLFAAMAILPVCVFATIVVTHLIALGLVAAGLAAHGQDLRVLGDLPLARLWLILAWGLFAGTLWWAPVWGWLLMASAWAKRMTFLWAVLPPIGLSVFERLAFDTGYVAATIRDRLGGSIPAAFRIPGGRVPAHATAVQVMNLPVPDPAGFFSSAGLWLGLAVGAAFIAAAIWLRRRAEPI